MVEALRVHVQTFQEPERSVAALQTIDRVGSTYTALEKGFWELPAKEPAEKIKNNKKKSKKNIKHLQQFQALMFFWGERLEMVFSPKVNGKLLELS